MCQENINLRDLDKSGYILKLLIISNASISEMLQDSCSVGNSNILRLVENNGTLNVNYYLDEVDVSSSEFLLKYCIMTESGSGNNKSKNSCTISRTNKREVFDFVQNKLIANSENAKFFFCKLNKNKIGRTIQKYRLEPIIYYAAENLNKLESSIRPFHEFIDDFDKININQKIKVEDHDRERFNAYVQNLISFIKKYDFYYLDKLRCNEIKITKTLWKTCEKRNQEYTIKITLPDRRYYEFKKNASDHGEIILTSEDFGNLFAAGKVFDQVLISIKYGREIEVFNVTELVGSLLNE